MRRIVGQGRQVSLRATRRYTTTATRFNKMAAQDQPFEKMEEQGVPKCAEPTKVAAPKKEDQEENLPKLTPQEFRQYNHMSEHMDMFHENFRRTWNMLYNAASSNKRPQGMSIRKFLSQILEFCHHLTIHHTIEEQHIFPILARRMDIFKDDGRHLEQHKGIHEGVEKLEVFVADVKSGERELDLRELKGVMDSFGTVLWTHLDEEVKTLRAENMRRFWSLEEMRRMPM